MITSGGVSFFDRTGPSGSMAIAPVGFTSTTGVEAAQDEPTSLASIPAAAAGSFDVKAHDFVADTVSGAGFGSAASTTRDHRHAVAADASRDSNPTPPPVLVGFDGPAVVESSKVSGTTSWFFEGLKSRTYEKIFFDERHPGWT